MSEEFPAGRPRPKVLAKIDLDNAYAKLGVSPLLSTEEIKRIADQKRREVGKQRRTRTQQQFGSEEAEMTKLQQIEELIGSAKNRAKYDQANPQNELLTVQPAPHDRWLEPRRRDALVSAWLIEELGRETAVPSPESLALWAPHGLSPELLAFLRAFVTTDSGTPEAAPVADESLLPTTADLHTLTDPATPPEGTADA